MSKIKKSTDIVQKENVIQAVLVADNFNEYFAPISDEIPMALLPIVNVPIIDYALECLALGGVDETFLFCCTHVDKIKEHIRICIEKKVEWTVTMKVNIIVSESCLSFGDALRDLDAKGLLRGDFILLNADTVSNIDFKNILQYHCGITKKDKGAAMTLILQNSGSHKKHRNTSEEILLVSDENKRILFYQKAHDKNKKVDFPLEIFLENSEVSIINNLRDTQIAICSPSVLPLFSDNFDFQTHTDFVRGLLMNEEILASTLYFYELKDSEYAARVSNWNMYQAVSHDIIHRWVYPLVPDINISPYEQSYLYLRNNIYRHKNVTLAKGSELLETVVVAQGTTIAESSSITNSVIGENCTIGKNVHIYYSYVLPNTVIEDGAVVSYSFIGAGCKIKKEVKITNGCILGSKVQVKGTSLNAATVKSNTIVDNANNKINQESQRVRNQSRETNSDSEDERLLKQFSSFHIEDLKSDSESECSESSVSDDEMSHMASPVPDDTNLFLSEVIDSLARGFEDKLQCDNLILEINSSRYAYNVTVREVNYNVVKAILNLPFQQSGDQQYFSSLRALLSYFMPILLNYIRNDNAMVDCLQAIEEVADTCSELSENVVKVLHWFYESDVLSEESIIPWYSKLNDSSRLKTKIQPFVKWLQEADEESDTESD